MKQLLSNFVIGDYRQVMKPLLALMNTVETGKVLWIPFHMMEVLRVFASTLALKNKLAIQEIDSQFTMFRNAKTASGDAWEHLFVATLLIRCLAAEFDGVILPLNVREFVDCTVDFNWPFNAQMDKITKVDEFVKLIGTPTHYPHISIYYPPHSGFEEVDVIVAAWPSVSRKLLYSYQCKEGKALPINLSKSVFEKCVVIRGQAPSKTSTVREWVSPRDADIDQFFGASGSQWTPKRWKELNK